MTCIVGMLDDSGEIYVGGDSAGVSGDDIRIRKDRKVFVKDDFIFGFSDSFRTGQVLKYNFQIPEYKSKDLHPDDYMHTIFLKELKICFKNNDCTFNDNKDVDISILIGHKNDLYVIYGDFQIEKVYDKFTAIGCGHHYALGALEVLKNDKSITTEEKVLKSLNVAEYFSTGVSKPFNMLKLNNDR